MHGLQTKLQKEEQYRKLKLEHYFFADMIIISLTGPNNVQGLCRAASELYKKSITVENEAPSPTLRFCASWHAGNDLKTAKKELIKVFMGCRCNNLGYGDLLMTESLYNHLPDDTRASLTKYKLLRRRGSVVFEDGATDVGYTIDIDKYLQHFPQR
jgi:hypothetical protein